MLFALLSFLLSTVYSHEVSDIYKAYIASKGGLQKTQNIREVVSPAPNDKALRLDDLFVPPREGQTGVDYHPQRTRLPTEDEPLVFYSWHIHSYFFDDDRNVTERSLHLRSEFIKTFNVPECDDECFMGGWMDTCTQGMCVWQPYFGVDGPHPYGQWGVYLPNEMLAQTVSWFSANHGEFLTLFHPNTGYMVGDHAPDKRAMWIGDRQVPLDIDFLVWLQCEWYGCSNEVSLQSAKF